MGKSYDATLRGMISENNGRINSAKARLDALKNQTSQFANDHRKIIALRKRIQIVFEEEA